MRKTVCDVGKTFPFCFQNGISWGDALFNNCKIKRYCTGEPSWLLEGTSPTSQVTAASSLHTSRHTEPPPVTASAEHPSCALSYRKPITGQAPKIAAPTQPLPAPLSFDEGCFTQEGIAMQPRSVVSVLFCCLQILSKHSRYFPFHQSWEAWIDFQPVIGLLPLWDQN